MLSKREGGSLSAGVGWCAWRSLYVGVARLHGQLHVKERLPPRPCLHVCSPLRLLACRIPCAQQAVGRIRRYTAGCCLVGIACGGATAQVSTWHAGCLDPSSPVSLHASALGQAVGISLLSCECSSCEEAHSLISWDLLFPGSVGDN